MRILIVSDIHANLAAFEAVLKDSEGEWDFLWFLGDLVGYGPDPNECVDLLREQEHISLSGNHDWAVLGRLDLETFNDDAQWAIGWTQDVLTEDNRKYIEGLDSLTTMDNFTLAHASPRHPVWEYIMEVSTAAENFNHFETQFCLVGHTHVPIIYAQSNNEVLPYQPAYSAALELGSPIRLILNPGSVGQPRDNDPRAAYAIYDTNRKQWQHHRVGYPIEVTQAKMRKVRLPKRLIVRLDYGW